MKNNILAIIGVLVLIALGFYWFMGRQPEPSDTMMTDETAEEDMSDVTDEEADAMQIPSVTISLNPVSGVAGEQSGMARFRETPEGVEVIVEVMGYQATEAQPAHIHVGSCPEVGEVKYPIENIVDGTSTTMLEGVTLNQLRSELPLALNVHKSAGEASVYTACGDLSL